ncbi:MAG TPA: magnesium transporter CorA family protein [Jatrophihabitans sp.]|jgi:magnesium transporter|uniref:magnesium transporter CorA family protein n=1 Tax=Jatrophihabitans sp. TaxID=1932789 RepID=UPI002E0C0AFA|nr:magnesium transporter CorA family protein [Jatrophihabitans sp.]
MAAQQIRTRVWRNGALEAENFPFEQVSDYLAEPDCLVWADLLNPDHETLCQLAEELSLDQHAVEDAVAEHERPKATRYSSHLFMTTYAIEHDKDTGEVSVGRVSAFSTKQGFVTVRLDDALDVDAVVRRWDDNADLLKYGPRALVHGLLDEIVDGYFTTVESLDDSIEAIEDILFDDNPKSAREVSETTFTLRRSLVQVRRAILPMREVVNTIMRRATADDRSPELAPYYEDLYDHVLRAAEWTESLRDMITSIFETNMSLSDTRMNMVMKKLTSWAAIIAVPTAVTGYFGQNVPYPGFGHESGFLGSLFVMVLIAGSLYVTFRRKDWL